MLIVPRSRGTLCPQVSSTWYVPLHLNNAHRPEQGLARSNFNGIASSRCTSTLCAAGPENKRERKGYTDIADAFFCERGGSKGAPRAVPRRPRLPFGNTLNTGAGHPPHPRAREGGTNSPTSGGPFGRVHFWTPTHPHLEWTYKHKVSIQVLLHYVGMLTR